MTPEEQAALDAKQATDSTTAPEASAKQAPTSDDKIEKTVVDILDLWSSLPQEASIQLLAMLNAQFWSEQKAAKEAPSTKDQIASDMANKVF